MWKKIIPRLLLLFTLGLLPFLIVKWAYVQQYDINYYKSLGQADHLITGLSRAKRGISPSILSEQLQLEGQMLNFAFNNVQSPYGGYYHKAIKRKLNRQHKDGLFVLSVAPGAMMDAEDRNGAFVLPRERHFFFYKLWMENTSPNIEYMLRSPLKGGASLFQFLRNDWKVLLGWEESDWPEIIHEDGWGELDTARISRRIARGDAPPEETYQRSATREIYLLETIRFLKDYGRVVLVRLPISEKFRIYEEGLYPGFSESMATFADELEVEFIDYSYFYPDDRYPDGQHLAGPAARQFSRQLAEDLKNYVRDGDK